MPGKSSNDLIAIDDALRALAALDSRQSQIVALRFFGGLSVKETAEVLTVSEETVRRLEYCEELAAPGTRC